MSYLPQTTALGKLEMVEVYEFYDRPLLFACRNKSDSYYLAVLVNEIDQSDVWLYVGTSLKRLRHIRSGGIDLHDAFAEAENGISYIVTQPYDGSPAELKALPNEQINPEWYPYPKEYLRLSTETLPQLDTVEQKAAQAMRIYTKIHLDFKNETRTEAPAKALGQVLVNFQRLVRATADYLAGRDASRGRIPESISTATELSLVGTGAGSFEVLLAETEPSEQLNLPGVPSILEKSLTELTELIDQTDDLERFAEKIAGYQPRLTSRYLKFLKELRPHVNRTRVNWASPSQQRQGVATLNSLTIQSAITYLEDIENIEHEIIVVTGEFIAGNSRTQHFEIATDSERYSGSVEGIDPEEYHPTLGHIYKARIRKIIKQRAAMEQPDIDYELLDLRPIESGRSEDLWEDTE